MSKNVCMFVWNNFTNDARVLRECTALSEEGYKVDLICIHDPTDKRWNLKTREMKTLMSLEYGDTPSSLQYFKHVSDFV